MPPERRRQSRSPAAETAAILGAAQAGTLASGAGGAASAGAAGSAARAGAGAAVTGAQVAAAVARAMAALTAAVGIGGGDEGAWLWIVNAIRPEFPQVPEDELRTAAQVEAAREAEFLRRMRARLDAGVPKALAAENPSAALEQLLAQERRFLNAHQEAAATRVQAAVRRQIVKRLSPRGAYWRMSPLVREHTPDCIAMAAVGWWPWEVLDRLNPPMHPGCRCELLTHDEAVAFGLMGPTIPDTTGAVARAAEIERAFAVLQEAIWVEKAAGEAEILNLHGNGGSDANVGPVLVHSNVNSPHEHAGSRVHELSAPNPPFAETAADPPTPEKAPNEALTRATDGGLQLVEAAKVQNGAMVALFPDPELATKLAIRNGERPAQLHVTLVFLGDIRQLGPPGRVIDAVQRWALECPSLEGVVSGTGVFRSGPSPVTYLSVDLPELPAERERLVQILEDDAGIPPSTDHGFTPHMTLDYASRRPKIDKAIPIRFDKVTVAWGGDHYSFVLGRQHALTESSNLAELQNFDPLDLEELFWNRRYAEGTIWGGRFMPKRGGQAPRITLSDVLRRLMGPDAPKTAQRGGQASPAIVPDTPAPAQAAKPPAAPETPERQKGSPARTFEEMAADVTQLAQAVAKQQGAKLQLGSILVDEDGFDTQGMRNFHGDVTIGPEARANIEAAAQMIANGERVPDDISAGVYHAMRTLIHEAAHSINPQEAVDYQGAGRSLEEALTEEMAHDLATDMLREQGHFDALRWLGRSPDDLRARGVYQPQRAALAILLDEARVPLENRRELLRQLKFGLQPKMRETVLAGLVHKANPEMSLNDARHRVRSILTKADAIDPLGQGAPVLQRRNDVDFRMRIHTGARVKVGDRYEGEVSDAGWNHQGQWQVEVHAKLPNGDTTWRYPDPKEIEVVKDRRKRRLKGQNVEGPVSEGDQVTLVQRNGEVLEGELRRVEDEDALGWKAEIVTGTETVLARPTSILSLKRSESAQDDNKAAGPSTPGDDTEALGGAEGGPQAPSEVWRKGVVDRVASEAHEDWRKQRNYEPRMKEGEDGKKVDIAALGYKDLPRKFQIENEAGAASAIDAILDMRAEQGNLDIEELSSRVHDAWVEHNKSWAEKDLLKPYADLTEEEKDKDRFFVRNALAAMGIAEPDAGPDELADVDGPRAFDARNYSDPRRALLTKIRALPQGEELKLADGSTITRGKIGDSALMERPDGSRRRYPTSARLGNAEIAGIQKRHGLAAEVSPAGDTKLALKQLSPADAPPESQLSPATPKEIESWFAEAPEGAYTGRLKHATGKSAAKAIAEQGFDPDRIHGGMVFATTSLTQIGMAPATASVPVAMRFDKPLVVEMDERDRENWQRGHRDQIRERVKAEGGDPGIGRDAELVAARDVGYDGVVIHWKEAEEGEVVAEWDWAVALNLDAVKREEPEGQASPPLQLGLSKFLDMGKKPKPKEAAAAERLERSMLEAPPEPVQGIPDYDMELTDVKAAGGSNGARMATDEDGNAWLVKTYRGDRDRVATELLANAIYRELGVRVPNAGRTTVKVPQHGDTESLTYPLIEGDIKRWSKPDEELAEGFVADALLANWDVVGLTQDNVLWNKGTPIRLDQGGTLEFRAMGQPKPFGPVPTELWSMNRPGGQAFGRFKITDDGLKAASRDAEVRLTPERLDDLVDAAPFADDEMRERVRENLKARVEWLGRFSRGEEGLPEPLAGPEVKAEFTERDRELEVYPEEDRALDFYLDPDNQADVDAHLRSRAAKEKADPEIRNAVETMDALLGDKLTRNPEDFYGWMELPSMDSLGEDTIDSMVGKWFQERSFLNPATEFEPTPGKVAVRILIPEGINALMPDALASLHDPTPGRVILPRGVRLQVTGGREIDGQMVIDMVASAPR